MIKVPDSPDGHLKLERLFNYKKMTLENVRIFGVRQIFSLDHANAKKKLFARKVIFDDIPDEICHSAEDSNELVCEKNPDYHNGASLISSSFPVLLILALIKSF